MPLIMLSINNASVMKAWVDAARALHSNTRSHASGIIMIGKGDLCGLSSKHKFNTKISSEEETVGASDFLPRTIWTKKLSEAQGRKIDDEKSESFSLG